MPPAPPVAPHSKYGAVRTTVDDITFASKMEARRYVELRSLQCAGQIIDLELQPRYPLRMDRYLICTYVADFRYYDRTRGCDVVEDVKGTPTAVYKLKKKLMKAIHGIDVEEVMA